MTDHTPGPWTVIDTEAHSVRTLNWRTIGPNVVRPAYFMDIGSGFPLVGVRIKKDDANLIAAAPDLLAACQEALQQLNAEGLDRMPAAIHARAAIAKAKGEQQ